MRWLYSMYWIPQAKKSTGKDIIEKEVAEPPQSHKKFALLLVVLTHMVVVVSGQSQLDRDGSVSWADRMTNALS